MIESAILFLTLSAFCAGAAIDRWWVIRKIHQKKLQKDRRMFSDLQIAAIKRRFD